jgi:23S rRNA (cytosine1962-C5)-methyltransferase
MLKDALGPAIEARRSLLGSNDVAVRLLNGFVEGFPALTVDLFARTLVLHDYSGPSGDAAIAKEALGIVKDALPFIRACVHKIRRSEDPAARRGSMLLGSERDVDRKIRENDVRYAIDLLGFTDGGFYLDTRELRAWAKSNLAGKRVLNTFAHTGSLGVAARAAPASLVVHTDKAKRALDVAKQSYALNGWPVSRADFIAGDFFPVTARLRKESALFDCVFVDPPFFSQTPGGRVELAGGMGRLIDKVRPLVGDGGHLAVVCNALWVSGAEYKQMLEEACKDGYMTIASLVSVPPDVKGFLREPEARLLPERAPQALAPEGLPRKGTLPSDPAPFEHPTKIALLSVKRKDGRKA